MSKKPHQPTLAEKTLHAALKQITTKGEEHGDTVNSFMMISELWTVYIKNTGIVRDGIELGPNDVAQLMSLLKIARSVYGHGQDNYIDGAGYTALASMLQIEKPGELI